MSCGNKIISLFQNCFNHNYNSETMKITGYLSVSLADVHHMHIQSECSAQPTCLACP